MTAAERQRRYRKKLKTNPEKKKEIQIKNLQRIKKNYVPINKLSESQKHLRRRNWRKLKKKHKDLL